MQHSIVSLIKDEKIKDGDIFASDNTMHGYRLSKTGRLVRARKTQTEEYAVDMVPLPESI